MTLCSSRERHSPCVEGIIRPVLVWPDGISNDLSDAQLDAIVRHELSHVRRRDNLVSLIHAGVEILFWFHPMVWWLGSRLVAERERACDENVLAAGVAGRDYAAAILSVCERSLSPAAGATSISGSVLARRMEAIMSANAPKSSGWFLESESRGHGPQPDSRSAGRGCDERAGDADAWPRLRCRDRPDGRRSVRRSRDSEWKRKRARSDGRHGSVRPIRHRGCAIGIVTSFASRSRASGPM